MRRTAGNARLALQQHWEALARGSFVEAGLAGSQAQPVGMPGQRFVTQVSGQIAQHGVKRQRAVGQRRVGVVRVGKESTESMKCIDFPSSIDFENPPDTHDRCRKWPMAKSPSFGVMHLGIAFGVTYALTGSVAAAGAVTLVEPVRNTVAHCFFGRWWQARDHRRPAVATVSALD